MKRAFVDITDFSGSETQTFITNDHTSRDPMEIENFKELYIVPSSCENSGPFSPETDTSKYTLLFLAHAMLNHIPKINNTKQQDDEIHKRFVKTFHTYS